MDAQADMSVGADTSVGSAAGVPVAAGTALPESDVNERLARLGVIVREIAIGGIAGVVGGILVVGVGGRVFMRLAAAIDPSATGFFTANGNRIGDITLTGTLGFVVFVGLVAGVFAAVLWATVAAWLPARGMRRALAAGLVAATIAPFFVIQADEPDFGLLAPPAASIAMILLLGFLLGAVVAGLDEWLGHRMAPARPATWWMPLYVSLVSIGALFVPAVAGVYLAGNFGSSGAPVAVGVALLFVGLATLAWWAMRLRDGLAQPPRTLVIGARAALAAAVILGALRLYGEIAALVA